MRLGPARAAVVLLSVVTLASPLGGASPYHPMEAQPDTGAATEWVVGTGVRAAQAFTPTAGFTVTRIALYVEDRGASDGLAVQLVRDAGGAPDDGPGGVLAQGTNDTGAVYAWGEFDLAPWIPLTADTRYWIAAVSGEPPGSGYAWRYTDLDAYARGNASNSSGGSWNELPGDFAFVVYGWTPASLAMEIVPDSPTVASGELIRYVVSLNNTGTEDASDVWVNASLDSRLSYAGHVGPGAVTVVDSDVAVYLPTVPAGLTSFDIRATAAPLLLDGAFLSLPATAEYSDGSGRQGLATTAILEARAPRVSATLDFEEATVDPGRVVSFQVTVSNSGRELAKHLWVNESLHPALTFLDETSGYPLERDGERQSWYLVDVLPGQTTFVVTLQVDPQAADATVVTHSLSLEFTDGAGTGLARAKSNTLWLRVLAPASSPWLWGSFAISATIVAGTVVALVRRRLRIEEIFLIHRSGVLLVHMSKSLKADHDSDILSGMFTAILNFVQDAFNYEERQELHGMDLGKYRVHIRKGSNTYLALVHTGAPLRWLSREAANAVDEIESQYGAMLLDWNGDVRALAGIRDILKDYFLSPTGPSRSPEWLRNLIARVNQTFKPTRPL